ncbi:MAG: hypothetical protein ACI85F_002144 [Bacteroidia bacterium]|jgi:hypothetical protein
MKHLLYLTFAFGLISCGSENPQNEQEKHHDQVQKDPEQRISELEAIVYSDTAQVLNVSIAIELAALYSDKAKENPTDSASADLLFRAGELYMNAKHGNKAIIEFKEVHSRFPGSERSATARFLKGFVAESVLADQVLAKRFYLEFLTAHPDHELSDDAQMSIDMLGLSDEELLARLKGGTAS